MISKNLVREETGILIEMKFSNAEEHSKYGYILENLAKEYVDVARYIYKELKEEENITEEKQIFNSRDITSERMTLKNKEVRILTKIERFYTNNKKCPTITEVQTLCNYRCRTALTKHLFTLEKKGFIERTDVEYRNIKPTFKV